MIDMIHPDGRIIEPLRAGEPRFNHVVRHLYRTEERWDLLIPELPPALMDRAEEAGCTRKVLRWVRPGWRRAFDSCRALVLEDHDRFYAPQYAVAVETGARTPGAWMPWDSGEGLRHLFLGENGVLALVEPAELRPTHNRHLLRSAYRCRPRGVSPARATQSDFVVAAVRSYQDKTSLSANRTRGTR